MTNEEAKIILKFHRPDRPRSTDRRQLQKAIDVILEGDQNYGLDARLVKIADHYGLDPQLDMLQEECAELIQAVNKYKRTRTTAIVEEMADVYIMLYQITYLLNKEVASVDVEDFIAMWMEKKIRRQLKRLEGEQNADNNDPYDGTGVCGY